MIALLRECARRFLPACVVLLCLAPATEAQEAIEPDRPDVTNGTHIVDIGLLQIEVGGLFTRATPGQHALGTPITARVGLTDWLEMRVGTDGVLTQTDGVTRQTGAGNTQLGAKLRLWADPGGVPVLSILPTINLPTASADKGLGSGDADFTLAVLTGTDIGRHWHADVNYGIGAIGAGGGEPHFVQHLASVSVSVAATDNWNPYVETFWFSRQDAEGSGVTAIDAGGIYQIGNRIAIDGGVQIGLHRGPADLAAFGGFSMIVGDVLGGHGPEGRARRAQARAARASTK
ncbi:MAG: transporter [Acidobacteriia bacterium]|nr:transporter [Terriglobia bacterium]